MKQKIKTERCLLRKVSLDDAQVIFDTYAQDDDVVRYLDWSKHQSLQDTINFVQLCQQWRKAGEEYSFAIVDKKTGSFIGMFALRPRGSVGDFGYVLAKDWWGNGYMTEILQKMLAVGFATFGFSKIMGYCDVENVGSARVMEKVGMHFVGIEKERGFRPALSKEKRDANVYEIYPH